MTQELVVQVGQISEAKRAIIAPVVDRMRQIDPSIATLALDENHDKDPNAGIAIAHLEQCGIEPIDTVDGLYFFHAARVFPGEGNFVNPHWHEHGEEPYLIIAGQDGEINLGRIVNGVVVWDEPRSVKAGDVIIVEEWQVHSLRNKGDKPYDFLFACPHSHLADKTEQNPKGDRQFSAIKRPGENTVDVYVPNGVPSHYPVQKA